MAQEEHDPNEIIEVIKLPGDSATLVMGDGHRITIHGYSLRNEATGAIIGADEWRVGAGGNRGR
jgi:hypothetical protein